MTDTPSPLDLHPGVRVRHPGEPGWGAGQVQSSIGGRVTVNFENRGKVVINAAVVPLEILDDDAG
jgi:hypothetical protein